MSPRTPKWALLRPVLSALLETVNEKPGRNVIDEARALLLGAVRARLPQQDPLGSRLMGVTIPTYRRWLAGMQPGQVGSLGSDVKRTTAGERELANLYYFRK